MKNFLQAFRLRRGWTQVELARRSGIDQTALSKIERGLLGLGHLRAQKLASALGLRWDELFRPPTSFATHPSNRSPKISGSPMMFPKFIDRDWQWFSNEDARMHLQTNEHDKRQRAKVWLENKGKRAFIPLNIRKMKPAQWNKLASRVQRERPMLERRWIELMVQKGWLTVKLEGHTIHLTAYPHSHNRFTRTIDLRRLFPGAYPEWNKNPPRVDIDRRMNAIRIGDHVNPDFRDHLPLQDYVFTN